MRTSISRFLTLGIAIAAAGCGGGGGSSPDSGPCLCDAPNHVTPMVIPGGGVSSGPIAGVVNVYVIDDDTRLPIAGAAVRVGTIDGTTDATGLFTATGANLVGPTTIAVKANPYESAMWVGANGGNITVDLKPAVFPVPDQASLSGTIAGFAGLTVATGHTVLAVVTYSQDDRLEDAANNLTTAGTTNVCGGATCPFTVTTRTGHVALIAVIYDHTTATNANVVLRWAYLGGLDVSNGIAQTGLSLALVDAGNVATETVDFGTPPAGLPTVQGILAVDVPTDGLLRLPVLTSPTATTVLAPKLAAFPAGADYRLTAFASNGTAPTDASSAVLRHPLTGTTVSAGTWLDSPTNLSVTTTSASWHAVTGALVYTVEYTTSNRLLSVTTFDGSTSFTVPDLLQIPAASGTLANVAAIAATLDVTNFALDTDREKLTAESAQPIMVGP